MNYTTENLRPIGRGVVVELLDPEDIVMSGFIVKASIENQEAKGLVIAIGTDPEICVKIGDTVLLSKLNPFEISFNGKRCRILQDREILAVLVNKK